MQLAPLIALEPFLDGTRDIWLPPPSPPPPSPKPANASFPWCATSTGRAIGSCTCSREDSPVGSRNDFAGV